MPQLVPFYFVNEITYVAIFLPLLIYINSKYILPRDVRRKLALLFLSRL
jgi:F-type H+-transporting ATPase subunit 8